MPHLWFGHVTHEYVMPHTSTFLIWMVLCYIWLILRYTWIIEYYIWMISCYIWIILCYMWMILLLIASHSRTMPCWVVSFDGYCATAQGSLDWFDVDLRARRASLFRWICVLLFLNCKLFWNNALSSRLSTCVLQSDAACCSLLQPVAVCCSLLQSALVSKFRMDAKVTECGTILEQCPAESCHLYALNMSHT